MEIGGQLAELFECGVSIARLQSCPEANELVGQCQPGHNSRQTGPVQLDGVAAAPAAEYAHVSLGFPREGPDG